MVYAMDKRFNAPFIRTAWNYVWNRRLNFLIAVTGHVGSGKSLTALKIGYQFDKSFHIHDSLVYSIHELIKKSLQYVKVSGKPISLEHLKTVGDIQKYLMDRKEEIYIRRGKVVILDETGATSAYVREFLSQDNKTISKLIQIWRILGMVVIFVVPEDIKLMDSTISRFLNMEIRMLRVNRDEHHATSIAWLYKGWNKKTKEPIRYRVKGCRHNGLIRVRILPKEIVKEYEDYSKVFKIKTMVDMGMQYEIDRVADIGRTKTLWDDVQEVKNNIKKYSDEKGNVTISLISSKLEVSENKARLIRANVAQQLAVPVPVPAL